MEAVEFNRLLADFEALGVTVLGTSTDSVERLQRFRDKHGLEFVLVSDAERTIGEAYGTLKSSGKTHERDTVVIGGDGVIAAAYQKVRAAGHAALVLAEVRRLREEALI